MRELTAPGSTSLGITRFGRSAQTTADELGPLADLVGTWIGAKGWELMAVPQDNSFGLIVRPYVEVLTVTPIGAQVPNRGGPVPDMFIYGVLYETKITDAVTQEPLHIENGMWLYMGADQNPSLARLAAIPHGDTLLALGISATTQGPPAIPENTAFPEIGSPTFVGYTDAYKEPQPSFGGVTFSTHNPNEALTKALAGLTISQTVALELTTADGGGILNVPFVTRNANATAFTCTFWIETVETTSQPARDPRRAVQQLQYSQQTNIEFLPKFNAPGLIMWPHVNVNTLMKQ
jgi:hypothetical protein